MFGSLFRPLPTETASNKRHSQNYESVSQNNNNNLQNGVDRKRKPHSTPLRNPTVNVISNGVNGNMPRSQSVGHSMSNKKVPNKTITNNGKSYDTRYALSQPLLINSEYENKPLTEGYRRASGTLSRKDIFYQVM